MSGGCGQFLSRRAVLGGAVMGSLGAVALPRAAVATSFRPGRVSAIRKYGVIELASGTRLVMPNLRVPHIPAPFGFEALAGWKALLVGQSVVTLAETVEPVDRYGHRRVAMWLHGEGALLGDPVNELILARGLARAREGFPSAEIVAREAGAGLWALPDYRVRRPDADRLAQDVGTHQIVEGVVVEATRQGGRTYLNFGSDYRTDFTVVVPGDVGKTLSEIPTNLAGARVRVRGFIELVNGPSLWLRSAANLSILN